MKPVRDRGQRTMASQRKPMSLGLSELPLPAPPAWEDIFGNARPVEVEIGPGKGAFLLAAAHNAPEHNFFGVEFSRRRVHRIKELIARDDPGNVLALAADIGCVLTTLIRPESVTTFHLYFPDPWWKRRHHRRRLFRDDFCAALFRALVPGGRILIATDVHTYFVEMVGQLEAVPGLMRFPWQRDQRNRNGKLILTDFERQFMDEGRPIHYAGFSRQASGSAESRSAQVAAQRASRLARPLRGPVTLPRPGSRSRHHGAQSRP